jgi:catechol 2,3-dioxygenase-like lactoylglutathione lyase family enzyme
MVEITSLVHFSIPVSDVAKSTKFYTDIVGCRHLQTVSGDRMAFLDAAGTCVILVKRDAPINPRAEDHGGVHHSFGVSDYPAALDHLRKNGVEITFEEDRQGGVVNGPRAYFHDPDGTVLEFIDLTGYMGAR